MVSNLNLTDFRSITEYLINDENIPLKFLDTKYATLSELTENTTFCKPAYPSTFISICNTIGDIFLLSVTVIAVFFIIWYFLSNKKKELREKQVDWILGCAVILQVVCILGSSLCYCLSQNAENNYYSRLEKVEKAEAAFIEEHTTDNNYEVYFGSGEISLKTLADIQETFVVSTRGIPATEENLETYSGYGLCLTEVYFGYDDGTLAFRGYGDHNDIMGTEYYSSSGKAICDIDTVTKTHTLFVDWVALERQFEECEFNNWTIEDTLAALEKSTRRYTGGTTDNIYRAFHFKVDDDGLVVVLDQSFAIQVYAEPLVVSKQVYDNLLTYMTCEYMDVERQVKSEFINFTNEIVLNYFSTSMTGIEPSILIIR